MKRRIEIVHARNSDGECNIDIFLNGLPVSGRVIDIDPGSGWTRSDWEQAKKDALTGLSPAAAQLAEELFDSFGDSPYIEEEA